MPTAFSGDQNQPQKPYGVILNQHVHVGLSELSRPASGLFLSSLSAGLDTGFSVLLMAVTLTLFHAESDLPGTHFLMANMYSVGFILVILGRSELFTEHTALAVLPVLQKRATVRQLMRLWGIVFAGNILGASAFAALTRWIAPALGVAELFAFERIASHLVHHPWWVILLSSVLAGWLMGELTWVIGASKDTISQIIFVWIITTAIGYVGLHHAVVGTAEVIAGMLSSTTITVRDFSKFLVFTTIGNAIGGVVFVALLKHGHAIRPGNAHDG